MLRPDVVRFHQHMFWLSHKSSSKIGFGVPCLCLLLTVPNRPGERSFAGCAEAEPLRRPAAAMNMAKARKRCGSLSKLVRSFCVAGVPFFPCRPANQKASRVPHLGNTRLTWLRKIASLRGIAPTYITWFNVSPFGHTRLAGLRCAPLRSRGKLMRRSGCWTQAGNSNRLSKSECHFPKRRLSCPCQAILKEHATSCKFQDPLFVGSRAKIGSKPAPFDILKDRVALPSNAAKHPLYRLVAGPSQSIS